MARARAAAAPSRPDASLSRHCRCVENGSNWDIGNEADLVEPQPAQIGLEPVPS